MRVSKTTHETMASDALERLAKSLGVPADLDDPEPALIAAVERAVAALIAGRKEAAPSLSQESTNAECHSIEASVVVG